MSHYHEVVIIGGGPAGMAAALGARDAGAENILIVERDPFLGGILNQCIHDGFGLSRYGESISGPEYAERMMDEVRTARISIETGSMVLALTRDRQIEVNSRRGYRRIRAGAVVLAMGCRERTRGMIGIPGTRPAGVWTAGCAQNLVNLHNLRIGSEAVILGSGDIGLIMARRLSLEGMKVAGVFELQPFCNGLDRNIRQCLYDYGIPLHLSTTVTEIRGRDRVESVVTADVDEALQPIPGSEREVPCDTLLLSVGLIPENELTRMAGVDLAPITGGAVVDERFMTSAPGIFAAGNVLHIHDIADLASNEAYLAGRNAAVFSPSAEPQPYNEVLAGQGLRYCLPQRVGTGCADLEISFRLAKPMRNVSVIAKGRRSGRAMAEIHYPRLVPSEMAKFSICGSIDEDVEVSCCG